ncbi:MAG: alkane 1-monooxygenase, partial [Dokdonella sp.]
LTTTITESWTDRRRYAWLASLVAPSMVFVAFALVQAMGSAWFWWTGPAVVYVLVPVLDTLFGADTSNVPESAIEGHEADRYYRWILFGTLPLQWASLVLGVWVATQYSLSPLQWLGLMLTVGTASSAGINAAHEWGHKRDAFAHWCAKFSLAPAAYGHFFVEHNRGHHKNVATFEDPASARLGESYWAFVPRTMIGSVRSAWRIEGERLAMLGRPALSIHNDNLQAWAITVVSFALLTIAFGWSALLLLVPQAVYAITLLEAVNYIEHYGLRRQVVDGRVERCEPRHSWNSNQVASNLMLYQLQRHSDHHANPRRAYQNLRHFDDSPQLPTGYGGLIPVALIPPLWFRVMNPRVLAHYDGDVSRANLQPGFR